MDCPLPSSAPTSGLAPAPPRPPPGPIAPLPLRAPCVPAIALAAILAVTLAVTLAGCGSTLPQGRLVRVDAPEWVADPASDWDRQAEPCVVQVTGRAPVAGDVNRAEQNAREAALAAVASFAEHAIERLDAVFAVQAGGILEPGALAALLADPGQRRQLVESARDACRVKGKWWDDDSFYVWLRCDADAGLLARYEEALRRKLAGQSRELTAVVRQELRAELERIVAERNAAP